MRTIDKGKALNELLWQAGRTSGRLSVSGYKAACKALIALDVANEGYINALHRLGYVRSDNGAPYEWLAKKIAEKAAK